MEFDLRRWDRLREVSAQNFVVVHLKCDEGLNEAL